MATPAMSEKGYVSGDEEEGSQEGSTTDSSGDEEEEEPKLRYRRLGGSVPDILSRDVASCMAVSTKMLALATHWGMVYLLDFNGNEIRKYAHHSATVQELCFDDTGDFLASCGDDGKVVIVGLYNNEVTERQFGRPVLSVALEPRFGKSKNRAFVSGGRAGKLILSKKGLFGLGEKNVILSTRDEGSVRALAWRGRFVSWTNDQAVKIYDVEGEEAITRIERPPGTWRPDLYRCSLFWASDRTLVIGWANMIKIGQIRVRDDPAPGEPMHVVHVSTICLDCFVCGMAPFGDYLTVLAYGRQEEDDDDDIAAVVPAGGAATAKAVTDHESLAPARPELKVIDPAPGQEDFVDLSSDTLPIEGYERYKPTDYRLHAMGMEALYYIVSPKDIVVATPRDLDDHIAWLLERSRFEQAFTDAERNPEQLKKHSLVEIGEAFLLHLLNDLNDATACAANCPRVLGKNAALWEKWVYRFVKKLQVSAIAGYIPIANPQLPKLVYEIVLNNFLQFDHERFLSTLREWPPALYDVETIINAVLDHLRQMKDRSVLDSMPINGADEAVLNNALAELYTYAGQFDKTLHIYLRLKRGNPFQLIEKHKLFANVADKVLLLMEFDATRAIEMLIAHLDAIPVARVVAQLRGHRAWLHQYLDTLYRRNPQAGTEFHELQVALYAEFDYPRLMPFLRAKLVKPEVALEVCRAKELYPEMVYILAQTGARPAALKLLIDKIGSVAAAIEFIQSGYAQEKELWQYLLSESLKSPDRISELLQHVGGVEQVDPIALIRRIPEGMQIPHLRDRLVKIISDSGLSQAMRKGVATILQDDTVQLQTKLVAASRAGVRVDAAAACSKCHVGVICDDGVRKTDDQSVIVFRCGHVFHAVCLLPIHDADAQRAALSTVLTQASLERQSDFACSICFSAKEQQRQRASSNAKKQ